MKKFAHRDIGERLRKVRGDIKQGMFCNLLGIGQPQYSRYEKGHIRPPVEILEKIAAYGKISIDWILLGEASKALEVFKDNKFDIGLRVRKIRISLGLSQGEFGGKVGLASNSISEIEGGKRGISGPVLIALENIWGINKDWLLTGEGERYIKDNKGLPPKQEVYFPGEDALGGPKPREEPGTPYGGEKLARFEREYHWVTAQVWRVLKYGSEQDKGKLKGFLAALDPGEKGEGENGR